MSILRHNLGGFSNLLSATGLAQRRVDSFWLTGDTHFATLPLFGSQEGNFG